ncbi:HAD domain-containing protein [Pandoraea terrae]
MLFLDYDNTLHRSDAYLTEQGVVASSRGVELFEFAPLLEQMLRPYPDVSIVLSTDWVGAIGFEPARDALPSVSLRERVIAATYDAAGTSVDRFSSMTRGGQVLRFVARYRVKSWLAIDDRLDGFAHCVERLVHCQPGVGLGDRDVQDMLARKLRWMFFVKGG